MKGKLFIIVFLLIVLIIGGVCFLKRDQLMAEAKVWRSKKHLEKAIAFKDEGNAEESRKFATTSYYLNPKKMESLRLLIDNPGTAELSSRVASAIFVHPDADSADRAKALDVFLASKNPRLIKRVFKSLQDEDWKHPEIQYRHARFLVETGSPIAAIKVLQQGPNDDPRFNFLKAAILSAANEKNFREPAQKELAAIVKSTDEKTAKMAFHHIHSIPLKLRDTALLKPAAEHWLQKHGDNTSVANQLILTSFDFKEAGGLESPAQAHAAVKQSITQLGDRDPVSVSNWLMKYGLIDEAHNYSVKAMANENNKASHVQRGLYRIALASLESRKKWTEMMTMLESPPADFSSMQIAVIKAVTTSRLNQKSKAHTNWREAWRYAELDAPFRNSYLELYTSAKASGEGDLAVRAMLAASKHKMGFLPSAQELTVFMIYLIETDRNDDLVQFSENLAGRREAFGAPIINNMVYLRELMDNPMPKALELTDVLLSEYPKTRGIETTKILVLINQEKFTEAHALAEQIATRDKLDLNKIPAAEALLICGAYKFANKELQKPAGFDIDAKMKQLLDVERQVFKEWF